MNKIQACAKLLSSSDDCRQAMQSAVNNYPISAQQHLTKSMGRRPWLGQAACCVDIGATEEETRVAWNFYMSASQQDMANRIADEVIESWEQSNA